MASCHVCGGTTDGRNTWPRHKPGCTLKLDATDCREADDLAHSCRFLGSCNAMRRRTAVQIGARGELCVAFTGLLAKLGPEAPR